jgi:hypothetical protein
MQKKSRDGASKRGLPTKRAATSPEPIPHSKLKELEAELARFEAHLDATREMALRDRDHTWKEAVETQRWFLSSGLAANLAGTWAMLTASTLSADARVSCLQLFATGIGAAFIAGLAQQWRWMSTFRGYNRFVRRAAAIRYRVESSLASSAADADEPAAAEEGASPEPSPPSIAAAFLTLLPYLPAALFVCGVVRAFSHFSPP